MKIFGAFFILISAFFTGNFIGEIYIKKLDGMKRAEALTKKIILALRKENMTVPEIFDLAGTDDMKTKIFLNKITENRFSDIEKTSLECGFCTDNNTNLLLSDVFSVLGKYSADEQIKELEFCRERISEIIRKSEEPFKSKAKLYKQAGIIFGFFILIIIF